MLIYFVRHGQTKSNAERRHQTPETPLSPEGEGQAAKLAERLKNTTIDEIWTSPMLRAKQTAEIINQYQQADITVIDELAEMKRPSELDGKLYSDPTIQHIGSHLKDEDIDPYYKYSDSESFVDLIERAKICINKLELCTTKSNENHTLVVTSHGIFLSTMVMVILLGSYTTPESVAHALNRMRHKNTGITLMSLSQKGEWQLLTYSDFAHL